MITMPPISNAHRRFKGSHSWLKWSSLAFLLESFGALTETCRLLFSFPLASTKALSLPAGSGLIADAAASEVEAILNLEVISDRSVRWCKN